MKYIIEKTPEFDKWLKRLKDKLALATILSRIDMIGELGNFGDHHSVGAGVSELRIFVGKGYRVYYTIKDQQIVFLLCGGDKSNRKTQQSDIKKAQKLLKELE